MKSIIGGIEARAAETIKTNAGDYIDETTGLLMCGKCHTKKQTEIEIFGEVRRPMCICKCEAERREKEEAERKRIELQKRVREYRRMGIPELAMQEWTFANDDHSNEKLSEAMRKYADNFEDFLQSGKGLLLFGTVGTGKTYLAACIANALIDKGYPVLMTNFARIANTVQGLYEGRQEYYDSMNGFPLLILDDLSAERKTEYMQEVVFNVIDSRYRAGLPLIVTTNLTSEELQHPSDIAYQRTFSRLLEMCLPVKVEGKNKRLEKLKADIKPMRDFLGL